MNESNEILFNFYVCGGQDIESRTLTDMLKLSDEQFESAHTVIQWLFPLNEISLHNKRAPILDTDTIEALRHSIAFDVQFQYVANRFLSFLKSTYPKWIHPHNHNYLRITRVIKCCNLLGQQHWATLFFKTAMHWVEEYPEEIGLTSVRFWKEAIGTASSASLWATTSSEWQKPSPEKESFCDRTVTPQMISEAINASDPLSESFDAPINIDELTRQLP